MDEFDEYDFMQELSPEEAQKLINLGTLDERAALLQQQLARAEALRQPGPRHSTPMGAAVGGIGDIFNAIQSAMQQRDIQRQQQELLGQKDAGRLSLARARAAALDRRRKAAMESAAPASGFAPLAPPPPDSSYT